MPKSKKNQTKKQKAQSMRDKALNASTPNMARPRKKKMVAGPQLSECAAKYALAISSPWDARATGACVPRHPSRPSQKVRMFGRATVTVGTNGFGFVNIMPCTANNVGALHFSTSTYAGTTLGASTTIAATGTTTLDLSSGPYPSGDFDVSGMNPPDIQARIVSVGVSIQYTGTKLNEGGLYYMLVDPNHQNLNGINPASFAECLVRRVTDCKEWLLISAVEERELDYYNAAPGGAIDALSACYPYSNQKYSAADSTGGAPACIWITGTAGNTFEVEIVQHVEFVGKSAQAVSTETHGDSVGFEKVATAAARLPSLRAAYPSVAPEQLMNHALTVVSKENKPSVNFGSLLGGLAGSYFGSAGMSIGAALGGAVGAML
jgi:hypothetical protein